jgi:hypothetical protein
MRYLNEFHQRQHLLSKQMEKERSTRYFILSRVYRRFID